MKTKDQVLGNYFFGDGLHPNKDGHLLMAARAAELLKSIFYLA